MVHVDVDDLSHHLRHSRVFEHTIISAQDALAVVGGFLVSTMVCRTIVMVEISRLRHSCQSHTLSGPAESQNINSRDEMTVVA